MADKTSEEPTERPSPAKPGQDPKAKKRKMLEPVFRGQREWTRLTGAPAWDLPPNDSQQHFTGQKCSTYM